MALKYRHSKYIHKTIFDQNPFISLEKKILGKILRVVINNIKRSNPEIEIGVCGEHTCDPKSIKMFNKMSVNYISLSSWKIPIAKLCLSQCTMSKKI